MREAARTLGRVKRTKLPRDLNQRAKAILDLVTGEREILPESERRAIAVESGRRGGLIGGHRRAAKLTAAQRSESARKAARARWSKLN